MIAKAKDVLHTNDRYNLKAMLEKLVIKEKADQLEPAPIDNSTWSEVVVTNFEIKNWPYIQSNQTYTCINAVLAYSPMNLFKLEGVHLKAFGSLTLLALGLSSI